MESINKLICPETESEIQSHWKYIDKVYISCVCIAYNHELYIRDTLDSILAQKTEYRFELVIHDDKSTDNTREILLEYKNKFPNIITLILQDENQYSKCKRIIPLTIPYLSGKYTTICEGDDFWLDSNKIQLQANALEFNKKYNICFTSGKVLYRNNISKSIDSLANKLSVFTVNQVIQGGGGFMLTASLMLRTKILYYLPKWYFTAPVGDYFLQIYASMPNGALYLPNITSIYRINSIGSWTNQRNSIPLIDIINEGDLYFETFNHLKEYNIEDRIINAEIAKQYVTLTTLAIKNNYLAESKKLIVKSWLHSKNINKKQLFLYLSRNYLFLVRWLHVIKVKFRAYK